MKLIVNILLMLIFYGSAVADTFVVGKVALAPCIKTEYRKISMLFGTTSIKVPEIKQASQSVVISTVIEGENIDDTAKNEAIQLCVNEASKIGIMVIASDVAGASPLFKTKLTNCLKTKSPEVKVATVYLTSRTKCAW